MNDKIKELMDYTKESGWDDEGGRPISPAAWGKAQAMLDICVGEKLPTPFVSPCGDGTIHFTWAKASGDRGVVEMDFDGYSQSSNIGMWTEIPKEGEPTFITITDKNADFVLGYLTDFLTKTE